MTGIIVGWATGVAHSEQNLPPSMSSVWHTTHIMTSSVRGFRFVSVYYCSSGSVGSLPQIWTRWLQVKRIQSGAPDYNPIPATAHKTPLLDHQPNLFNSTLIRRYCRQLDFYTGEDNHMGCECPVRDSSPGKNVKITY